MANNGATKDYKFGNKNNWRRQCWNEIIRRLEKPTKSAVVLYLPGPDDLDRKIATEKGFSPENLIAVDLCKKNIDRIKNKGCIGINANLTSVIYNLPKNLAVDVVFGDFCSGITNRSDLRDLIISLFMPNTRTSICCFNFMRGRDKFAAELRKHMEDINLKPMMYFNGGEYEYNNEIANLKHRGVLFYEFLRCYVGSLLIENEDFMVEAKEVVRKTTKAIGNNQEVNSDTALSIYYTSIILKALGAYRANTKTTKAKEKLRKRIYTFCSFIHPKYFEYKSGKLTFDSLVFCPVLGFEFDVKWLEGLYNKKIKNQLQALSAIRTMRIDGTLPRSASR